MCVVHPSTTGMSAVVSCLAGTDPGTSGISVTGRWLGCMPACVPVGEPEGVVGGWVLGRG